jgi:hypothetical protein
MASPSETRRPRSTAALVLTRPDPPPSPPRSPAEPLAAEPDPPWPAWFRIATAVVLGAAVAGLWALLLLGDCLSG